MEGGTNPRLREALVALAQHPGVLNGYFRLPPAARISGATPFDVARRSGAAGAGAAVVAGAVPQSLAMPLAMARNFAAGCIAACGAVTLTNPWDVIRTRLELQVGRTHALPSLG